MRSALQAHRAAIWTRHAQTRRSKRSAPASTNPAMSGGVERSSRRPWAAFLHESFPYDWVPIVFATFKVIALGVAMYFAVKWQYDQGEKGTTRALLQTGDKVIALFTIALAAVGLFAFSLSRMLGLDLNLP